MPAPPGREGQVFGDGEIAGGAVIFRLMIAGALHLGLDPNSLKLITAVFVVAALVVPRAFRSLMQPPSLEGRNV